MPIRPSHHRPQPSAGPARQRARGPTLSAWLMQAFVRLRTVLRRGSADPLVDAAMKRFARRTQRAGR